MLCPKCRIKMDKVDVQDVEVDRCQICKGIWFDEGESEKLRSPKAAAKLDTGDPWEGKQLDFINRYQCPRCGGKMTRAVDSKQQHIQFETCNDCHGSFFDAGEFKDLSSRSISDLFKRVMKRGRI